jgi:uncharacterized protein
MIVVTNAGPLIALAQIGHFDLLSRLYRSVYIPPAVHDEVVVSGRPRPGAVEAAEASWVHIAEPQNPEAVRLLRERLDAGESEAIALAIRMQANLLLIDEARGRRVAEAWGLHTTGTLGILIAAKRLGHLPRLTPLLDALQAAGFRMSLTLYETAQQLADEP